MQQYEHCRFIITARIMNPFKRKQESEADYLGMIFSSLSGYDIRETKKFGRECKNLIKGNLN